MDSKWGIGLGWMKEGVEEEEEEGKEGGSGVDFGKVSANDDGYCRL